jgi:hypothetical protein
MLSRNLVKALGVYGFYLSLQILHVSPLFADPIIVFSFQMVVFLLFVFICLVDFFSLSAFLRSVEPKPFSFP